jgi:hypothetical protein
MAKTVSSSLLSHLQQETATLATCWEIKRPDGFVVRLTDHDEDITFEGSTYKSSEGYTRTAISNSGNLQVDNLDISGFLAEDISTTQLVYDNPEDSLGTPTNTLEVSDTPDPNDFTLNDDTVIGIDLTFSFVPSGSIFTLGTEMSVEVSGGNLVSTIGDGVNSISTSHDISDYSNLKGTLLLEVDISANTLRSDFIPDDGEGQVINSELTSGAPISAWSSGVGGSIGSSFNGLITEIRQYDSTEYPAGFPNSQGSSIQTVTTETLGLKEEDIRKGLYDFSELRIFLVNFEDLTQGSIKLRRGFLGEMFVGQSGRFQAEFRGLQQSLQTRIGEATTPTCRADVGDSRCTVPIQPSAVLRNQVLSVGDYVRAYSGNVGATLISVPILNADFEDGPGGDVTPQSWENISGDTLVGTRANLTVASGSRYLTGASPSDDFVIAQTVNMQGVSNFDGNAVDAGEVFLRASLLRGTVGIEGTGSQFDPGRFRIEALDSQGRVLKELFNTGFSVTRPFGTWILTGVTDSILPATTRQLRFYCEGNRSTGSIVDAAFDNIQAELVDMGDMVTSPQEGYENRIYEVTTAGTTSGTEPAYDTIVGNTTTDGTAVLTARQSWTRHAEIATVIDRRRFTITVTETRALDDWFNDGVVIFESGNNTLLTMEIKDWTQSSSTVELFLPMPGDIQIGDKLRIFPGCPKTVNQCRNKWVIPDSRDFSNGNVINFRGEPYLPGKDAVVTYPDAK